MRAEPHEDKGRCDLARRLREIGFATVAIPWTVVNSSEVFARFETLLEDALASENQPAYSEVDELLVHRAGTTPLLSTTPLKNLHYALDGLAGFGHSYFPGTLRAVREHCSIPPLLEDLWETLEAAIATAEPELRSKLSVFPGTEDLPSGVRVWKNLHTEATWTTPPHYDLTVFSAILATLNPREELLTIGLEANGAPIKMVRARTTGLRQFAPTPDQFGIVLPGIYSNRWQLEPTWHYVRALPGPGACRYSLVWSLVHPPHQPIWPTRHAQDEVAPNEVVWT